MRIQSLPFFLALGLLAGCSSLSATKPVENLDERSGITVASLKSPIEMLPTTIGVTAAAGKRVTFAYLGPVEWDQAGAITNALWVDIAPGNDRPLGDIRTPGAITLILDEGPVPLTAMAAPALGRAPYKPAASWGQSAYFNLTPDTLRHMASSRKLELEVRTQSGAAANFSANDKAGTALTEYLKAHGTTDD
jgi:hypothetical protein